MSKIKNSMKPSTITLAIILIIAFLLVLQTTPAMANTPEGEVAAVINTIKSKRNMAAIADSIDWESAYESFSEGERKDLKVESAEQLKEHFKKQDLEKAEKDVERFKKSLESNKVKLTKEEAIFKKSQIKSIDNEFKQQKAKMSKLIGETRFKILGSEITGETAKVKILKHTDSQSEQIEIHLKKISGKWKLLSAAALNPLSSSKGAGNNPLGTVTNPSQALAMP